MKKFVAVFLSFLMLFSFSQLALRENFVKGASQPIWAMFRYNAQHTGLCPYNTSASSSALKWKYQISNKTYIALDSSPAIGSDGTIYVGSDDYYLYAIKSDGSLKWKYQTNGGIHSSPAIASDGTIYVGSGDYYLHAINPDGTLKWKYKTGDFILSSPAIASDGTIYVGSSDHYLYAINSNGALKWKFDTLDEIESSPAIASDGTVYVGSRDHYLWAINSNGTKKWEFKTGDAILSSPAIASDGTVYIGSSDQWNSYDYTPCGYLYAFNSNGALKWKFHTAYSSAIYSSPAIGSDGTVYVGSTDHYLYAIKSDGTLKWKYQTLDVIESSSPAIGSNGTIYVGSRDHYLYAINSNGTLGWSYQAGKEIDTSPAIGSDGTIYFVSWNCYLYAIGSFTITALARLGGTITPSGTITVKTRNVTFTITPKAGYKISDVKVDGVSVGAVSTYTFPIVLASHTISATFEKQITQTVIILQIGNSAFTVNGISNTLDSPPIIKNGRTLVPIRAIIESLGGTVGWDAVAKKVTVMLGSNTIDLWIGKSIAKANSVDTPIDSTNNKVVPEIINSRTMLPLRFVAENVGATVDWGGTTQTVTITYQAP